MQGQVVYVPILKGKQAEFAAVRALKRRQSVVPLFEVVPHEKLRDDTQIEQTVEQLAAAWDGNVFLDLTYFGDGALATPDGSSDAYTWAFSIARQHSLRAIPVLPLQHPDAFNVVLDAAIDIVATDNRGIVFRLTPSDFIDSVQPNSLLDQLMLKLQVAESDVDLILDFGSVEQQHPEALATLQLVCLKKIPQFARWRTITLASGAFPQTLKDGKPMEWRELPRVDWLAWKIARDKNSRGTVHFADYAVSHPDLGKRVPVTLPNVRYSVGDRFLVSRGKISRFEDVPTLCRSLVKRDEFSGEHFSDGDRLIRQAANDPSRPGNGMIWRRMATSHHLEFVADQLASLPDA